MPSATYVEKKYQIENFTLLVPKDNKDKDIDIKNSIMLDEHLYCLPKYVLTDERFWNWINFDKGYQVANIVMPLAGSKSVFKDHWLFTQGNRRGLFFGVLSRCYFRVALTVDESLEDKYELTRFVIEKPTRFRELSWRAISNHKHVVLGLLKAEKKIFEEYGDIEKDSYFKELPKELSKLGSVKLLDVMSEQEIYDFVYNKYKNFIEIDKISSKNNDVTPESKTFLKRIFK